MACTRPYSLALVFQWLRKYVPAVNMATLTLVGRNCHGPVCKGVTGVKTPSGVRVRAKYPSQNKSCICILYLCINLPRGRDGGN